MVTSTDLSHYPRYQDAVRVDQSSIQAVVSLDPLALEAWDEEAMSSRTANLHTTMCGKGPVMVSMLLARSIGAEQVHVIHYANSGDVPEGEQGRVVGYAAIEFVKGQPPALTAVDKTALLKLARVTLDEYLQAAYSAALRADLDCAWSSRVPPSSRCATGTRTICAAAGAKSSRAIRCGKVCSASACSAPPTIPVSGPMTPCVNWPTCTSRSASSRRMRLAHSPDEVIVGKHGVMIRTGGHGGLFLPQVPVEQGWDRDEYLSTLCWMKAGLPADAWRKKDVQLYIFEAEIFEE